MRNLVGEEMQLAVLNCEHKQVDEMKAGNNQKALKEPVLMPLFQKLYLLLRLRKAQFDKMDLMLQEEQSSRTLKNSQLKFPTRRSVLLERHM